jgi:LysR family transcriptional regulator, cyn operon transcriptional activator
MLLRHVRYLMGVAEQGSFTRAAQALHVSQPALSQQIRQLEERMGVELLDRSGRVVRPTDAGEAFLAHARRALGELEAGERAVRDVADLSTGTLRIGVTPSFSAYLVAPLIRRFHERYPGILLSVVEIAQEEMEPALGVDALDLGIAFSEVAAPDIEWLPLHEERLALLVGPAHPAGGTMSMDCAALADQEMVMLGKSFATRQLVDAYLQRHNIRPRVAVEASSIAAIFEIVRSSRLATILPDAVAHEQNGFRAVALVPPIDARRVALLQRRGGYRSAAARAFTALAEDYACKVGGGITGQAPSR